MKNFKLFKNENYKTILKDAIKFYIYVILFYSLEALLLWGHSYWALESEKIDLEDLLSRSASAEDLVHKFQFENYDWLAKQMNFYMFILVCFGVFFSSSPKSFKHITAVTCMIFIIAKIWPPEYSLQTLYDFGLLYGFILVPWILSFAWREYLENRQKPAAPLV